MKHIDTWEESIAQLNTALEMIEEIFEEEIKDLQ
jgi:hypothetical protein